MTKENSSQNLRSLSQADIIRLGKMTGLRVLSLPEDFVGSSKEGERAIEAIVDDMNLEAIAATNTQIAVPEEIDDQI